MNLPKAPVSLIKTLALEAWLKDGNTGPLPKVYNLAVRGYRAESMGPTKENDFGYFDDAFFLVTPEWMLPANANTDPSRLGWNEGVGKPYGMLKPGVWWMYSGAHKGRKPALRQADDAEVAKQLGIPHEGKFHIRRMWGRDDPRNYDEWGHQQVNLHFGRGPITGTSSWLCLTVPEGSPWIQEAVNALKKYGQKLLPNILIEGPII
ncbi:hypothetical protein [Luteolibacter soli]|uniref:Uncharacterized protein n=1 Tax=Luteolibacter soli TaxID=3135280 RepID=A0ABU9B1R9_9BACT